MTGAPADLSEYATQFNELQTEERTTIIDLNAIFPLSELRSNTHGLDQNVTSDDTEHHLSTSANTNDEAHLETVERGEYTAGYQVIAGNGVRVPKYPTGDSVIRWGYYEQDNTHDTVLDGFYYGIDADGLFVARARGGQIERVYQDNWNGDPLDSTGKSGVDIDMADGYVTQTQFVYYGYGSVDMKFLIPESDTKPGHSSTIVTAHTFNADGETSIKNTNLPLHQEISSGGTSNDALDLFVGGRQFSLIGQETTNSRTTGHYYPEQTGVDDTKWHHLISFQLKDGTDVGTTDFTKLLAEVTGFEITTDNTAYRWQIRRGTTPSGPTWQNPTSAEDHQDEAGLKVDTASADIQDVDDNLTGVMVDGGSLSSGANNDDTLIEVGATGTIAASEIVSLVAKAVPGGTGTLSNIYLRAKERW